MLRCLQTSLIVISPCAMRAPLFRFKIMKMKTATGGGPRLLLTMKPSKWLARPASARGTLQKSAVLCRQHQLLNPQVYSIMVSLMVSPELPVYKFRYFNGLLAEVVPATGLEPVTP